MIKIRPSRPTDLSDMFTIWLDAVRATHSFLTKSDIAYYAEQVRDHYLPTGSFWVAIGADDWPRGFMGMTGSKIDALFVHPSVRSQGYGRALVEYAERLVGDVTVDVNEQNEGACLFYGKLGFRRVGRSEFDDSGKPLPILHLARRGV